MSITIDISSDKELSEWYDSQKSHKNIQDILKTSLHIGIQSLQLSESKLDSSAYFQPMKDIANETKDMIGSLDDKINDIFHFKSNAVKKGQLGENIVSQALIKRYPSWDIIDMSHDNYSGDLHAKNTEIGDILYEIKHYTTNINKEQVTKFYRDLDNTGCKYGIFVSHTSGIVGRKNIEWELKSGKLCIYVSNIGLNGYGVEIATELLLTLVSMNIMNPDENHMLHYNVQLEGIMETMNDHITDLQKSVIESSMHHQLVVEQTKKIHEHLYAIERSSSKCEMNIEFIYKTLVNQIKDIDMKTTNIVIQDRDNINKYIETLDEKYKNIFTQLYKLCYSSDIDIIFQDKDWLLMKQSKLIAYTKLVRQKYEIRIPIEKDTITLHVKYETIKGSEIIIQLLDNPVIVTIIRERLIS